MRQLSNKQACDIPQYDHVISGFSDYIITTTRYSFSRQLIKLIQSRIINCVFLIPSNARNLMQTAIVICQ